MMDGRHLPARQGMPPQPQQQDPSRRRPYNQQQFQPQHGQVYGGYMNPYNNYYQPIPPHYQHPGMPPTQYVPYQNYGRSPPPQFQQYAPTPPPIVSSYPRPHQSPVVVSTPYQPPPPHTPVSSQSSHTVPLTPSTPQMSQLQTPVSEVTLINDPPPPPPFIPPLPWLSRPEEGWPTQGRRSRRRRKVTQSNTEDVSLPNIHPLRETPLPPSNDDKVQATSRSNTPSTSQQHSEEAPSTTPTTPSSAQQAPIVQANAVVPTQSKSSQRPAAAIPIVPIIPKASSRTTSNTVAPDQKSLDSGVGVPATNDPDVVGVNAEGKTTNEESLIETAPVNSGPKLWANLFKGGPPASTITKNGTQSSLQTSTTPGSVNFNKTNNDSLAEALRDFSATAQDAKLAFLKPRGLVNTGNMCYMNSVLQVLVFCTPFYNFLDLVGRRATHSFKSDTPLIDAMIMFMREFSIIDSATSIEQLRMRLKENELEQYGEPFTPDFLYDVVAKLPRFATMRRGHQEDAEEFLGFLLEGLHDECVQVMRSASTSDAISAMTTPTNAPSSPLSDAASLVGSTSGDDGNAWLEVGPKQRSAITRSSGTISLESPLTKIFGGTLRSEFRVPGLKNSVTMEPFQPLQLDIGSSQINNIVDALKGLTRSESLHGDFNSPRGPNVSAAKQVMIETLPPVLILHLKRFQYDNTGGTQKIWKKIGYPLELEIPKEVFSRQKASAFQATGKGLPRYRLIAVVYHHGKNASGGHYTVDVRRQEGREWVRLDDTVIRRVRSEDVAEGGSEEDPKVIAATLEAHKKDSVKSGNLFNQINMDDEEDGEAEEDWKQVNGSSASSSSGTKKYSSVINGTTPPKGKNVKSGVKDNKVAYLLFYQKIAV